MSRDAFGRTAHSSRIAGRALLYLWMKACSRSTLRSCEVIWRTRRIALGARRILHDDFAERSQPTQPDSDPPRRPCWRCAAWVYGFYQNFTLLADARLPPGPPIAQAKAYPPSGPGKSWLVLSDQAGFAIFVAVNIAIAIFLLRALSRVRRGGTTFTKSGANLLSSTFFAVCLSLTYLCV